MRKFMRWLLFFPLTLCSFGIVFLGWLFLTQLITGSVGEEGLAISFGSIILSPIIAGVILGLNPFKRIDNYVPEEGKSPLAIFLYVLLFVPTVACFFAIISLTTGLVFGYWLSVIIAIIPTNLFLHYTLIYRENIQNVEIESNNQEKNLNSDLDCKVIEYLGDEKEIGSDNPEDQTENGNYRLVGILILMLFICISAYILIEFFILNF